MLLNQKEKNSSNHCICPVPPAEETKADVDKQENKLQEVMEGRPQRERCNNEVYNWNQIVLANGPKERTGAEQVGPGEKDTGAAKWRAEDSLHDVSMRTSVWSSSLRLGLLDREGASPRPHSLAMGHREASPSVERPPSPSRERPLSPSIQRPLFPSLCPQGRMGSPEFVITHQVRVCQTFTRRVLLQMRRQRYVAPCQTLDLVWYHLWKEGAWL